MHDHNSPHRFGINRRGFALSGLALGTAAALGLASAAAQGAAAKLEQRVASVRGKLEGEAFHLLGMEAYVYGYPLVMMEVTRDVMTDVAAPAPDGTAAPINQFAKMPTYVSPDFKNVVRISLSGLWLTAWLDLGAEPQMLSVPEVPRYFVMSVMDNWTNVFASFGPRTTGTGPGAFLIAGPRWQGEAPEGVQEVVRSPTRYAWILGQTEANGPDDFATANAIQKHYRLTPLSA